MAMHCHRAELRFLLTVADNLSYMIEQARKGGVRLAPQEVHASLADMKNRPR